MQEESFEGGGTIEAIMRGQEYPLDQDQDKGLGVIDLTSNINKMDTIIQNKYQQRLLKKSALSVRQEKKKRRAMYGSQASSKIFDHASIQKRRKQIENVGSSSISNTNTSSKELEVSWKQKLIINHNNKPKSIFDIGVLLLVGYSCVTTTYKVAFNEESNERQFAYYFDITVELLFVLDLILNFFQSFVDAETYEVVVDFK